MDRSVLENKALAELREIASTLDLKGFQRMKKADLVSLIIDTASAEASNGSSRDGGATDDDSSRDEGSSTDEAPSNDDVSRDDASSQDDGSSHDEAPSNEDGSSHDDGRGRGGPRRRRNKGGGQGSDREEAEVREGVLDLLPEGYGFLRTTGYLSGAKDVYVSQSYVRRFSLRRGDRVRGPIRSNNRGSDKFPALARVETVEGLTVDEHLDQRRTEFSQLTPLFPTERIRLDSDDEAATGLRVLDLIAPIGQGQRALIVSPPRAGKTTLLKQIARAIEANQPDSHLMVVLVDERPEEVTEFERACDGEVISSTFDRPAEDHTQVAELSVERAKRLVERGRDVVVLLDSLTALARAYNHASSSSGRTLPGGIDSGAVHPPKRFFGAARNVEEGGSLTIIATALVETGSAMDEVILEEFVGTANMELRLDGRLASRRVFPGIDVHASGTRREELLCGDDDVAALRRLRRELEPMDPPAALELLLDKLNSSSDNEEFLRLLARGD